MVRGVRGGETGECEQETEEEEDAGGRVVDVAGAKVMGISFSREFAGSVCTSSSPASFFFQGPRSALPRFSIRPFTRITERASLSKVYYNCSRKERIVLEIIFFFIHSRESVLPGSDRSGAEQSESRTRIP